MASAHSHLNNGNFSFLFLTEEIQYKTPDLHNIAVVIQAGNKPREKAARAVLSFCLGEFLYLGSVWLNDFY